MIGNPLAVKYPTNLLICFLVEFSPMLGGFPTAAAGLEVVTVTWRNVEHPEIPAAATAARPHAHCLLKRFINFYRFRPAERGGFLRFNLMIFWAATFGTSPYHRPKITSTPARPTQASI